MKILNCFAFITRPVFFEGCIFNIRKIQQKMLDSGAYPLPLFVITTDRFGFQLIQRFAASGILKVKGEPYKWANRSCFYPDSTITITKFTNGLNFFSNKVNILADNYVATILKARELISEVVC